MDQPRRRKRHDACGANRYEPERLHSLRDALSVRRVHTALVQAGIMRVVFVPEMTSKVEQHYRIVVSMFDEAGVRMIPIGRDGQ